jgi:MFS transporter, ACS family, solute carrier family 17 (sodium-dependent inorganic phosphate cotransporter), other
MTFTAGIYLFGCIIYWIWAQGEVQPWAVQEDINATENENVSGKGTKNRAFDTME